MIGFGAGDLAQLLRALDTLPEDPGGSQVEFPGPIWWLTTVYNSGPRGSNVLFWPKQVMHEPGTHTCM